MKRYRAEDYAEKFWSDHDKENTNALTAVMIGRSPAGLKSTTSTGMVGTPTTIT